jgi:hypothetical protein
MEIPMDHPRRAAMGALLAACLLLVSAGTVSAQVATLEEPGASPGPSAAAEESDKTPTDDPQEAMLAYAQCMRDHGIDMDDPQFASGDGAFMVRIGGPGERPDFDPESEGFQAAQEACGQILEASRPRLDPEAQAELLEQQLAMAQCLRDNGVDGFPDPVMDSDGRMQRFVDPGTDDLPFDPFSAQFQQARETCARQLGIERGPGFGGPPPGDAP